MPEITLAVQNDRPLLFIRALKLVSGHVPYGPITAI